MAVRVTKSVAEGLGFDLETAVAAFARARAEHAHTVNVPAPTAHSIVEEIVRTGGAYEIVEEESGEAEGSGNTFAERLAALEARLDVLEAAAKQAARA